ncbi:hypothetical protein NOK12_37110 [Nocardioides sp. OK12]|uniref:hypothetical protein n=1 Tax=Nocardioides sp. OK12 TaxID=2758661 RepID=UPI0021C2C0F4|nr:hypothetical protein [Nocardioides sp. OK12]GHJ61193.1 hypothetical protein NOK12_37110 [Nocardioides sp. OK12]
MLLPRAHASVLSALLLLALLLGVTAPVSAEETRGEAAPREARTASVTFPDIRGINPTLDEYVVEVGASDYDSLRAAWKGHRTTLAPEGSTVVALPVDGIGTIVVSGCVAEKCKELVRSKRFTVLRALHSSWGGTVRANAEPAVVTGVLERGAPSGTGNVAWDLVPADSAAPATAPVASGKTGYSTGFAIPAPTLRFSVQVPPEVPEATYELRARLTSSTPTFGELEGELSGTVVVDRTAPVIESLETSRDDVYPPRDQYRDNVAIKALASPDTASGSYSIRSATGEVVQRGQLDRRGDEGVWRASWRGESSFGQTLPTGDYVVHADVVDEAGNRSAPAQTTVAVVAQRVRQRKFVMRLRPTDVELDRNVGRCSRLKSPSSRRSPGSVGFFSALRCDKPAQAHVVTSNGVYLPHTVDGRYKNFQLSVTGGRSKRHRNKAQAYLVVHLVDPKGRLVERTQLGRRYRQWRLDKVHDDLVHDRETARPYVIWNVGLSEGSRYDVDEYRLRGFRSVLKDVPTD